MEAELSSSLVVATEQQAQSQSGLIGEEEVAPGFVAEQKWLTVFPMKESG